MAQQVEEEVSIVGAKDTTPIKMRWIPPKKDWLMCNVGFDWVKQTKLLRVAWVVRNHRGVVIIHSWRAFSNIESLDDVRVVSVLWAVESMTSLHYNRVVFAGDFREIFVAAQKPLQWPAM